MSDTPHELEPPFEILEPSDWRGAIVFNSPHSGNIYPHAFLATARAWEKQGGLSGKEVRFVLKTGRNWLGPIGRFRLTFEKLDAKAIVSTCFKGMRKTGPTTFAASLDNFSPDEDLGFLVLSLFKSE